jgi:type IV secretory pathway TrbD component
VAEHINAGDQPRPASEQIHLPGPSYQPVVVAFGMTLAVVGVVISYPVCAIGLLIFFVATFLWIKDTRAEVRELPIER